jgi:N6-L-threonylcarbamoyladenine synthase
VVSDDAPRIRANLVLSQVTEHSEFGGVVPEVAARAHLMSLDRLVTGALAEAEMGLGEIDGIAVAGGPGLIGGVMVGVMLAKGLALASGLPFLAVNHLEAHALTARLTDDVPFPFLLLLVSGGHCQLLIVEQVGRYRRLGTTLDDAAGECFDKGAKLLGLGFPGGPLIERAAERGDARRFLLPRPLKGKAGANFSFSGLKTALRERVAELGGTSALDPGTVADLAAGLQVAIADTLVDRTRHAIAEFQRRHPEGRHIVLSGGVAANGSIRRQIGALAAQHGLIAVAPPVALCTDNGAMIAWAGLERLRVGLKDGLDFAPRPRWPLDASAERVRGAGVKA